MSLSTIIVLDDIDFLLLNDGDDLLYFLSRLENAAVITLSATHRGLESEVDDRTYSSFQPQVITFSPYPPSQVRQILAERARQALESQSVERAALSRIASQTANIAIGLAWLRVAAAAADDAITRDLVDEYQSAGYAEYVTGLLDAFTPHHRRVYETIALLQEERERGLQSGEVYAAYRDRCAGADVRPLSDRRLGDFLTHLELLDLIDVTYHYGGSKGKTREVRLVDWTRETTSEEG